MTTIQGTPGNDRIGPARTGGSGNGLPDATDAADSIDGAAGDDTILAGNGDDSLAGGEGGDAIFGGVEDVLLQPGGAASDGNDTLLGGSGDDSLVGGSGDDRLLGADGNDRLFGAEPAAGSLPPWSAPSAKDGSDLLDGGAGRDLAAYDQRLDDVEVRELGAYGAVVTAPLGTDRLAGVEVVSFWAPMPWAGSSSIGQVIGVPVVLADDDPYFDPLWYLRANLDVWNEFVVAADPDAYKNHPREHYAAHGWHEGRDPNPWFGTSGYLAANRDVAAAGLDPLEHYIAHGAREGRDPGLGFDAQRYLALNPDVAAAGMEPLAHFLEYGRGEGRTGSPAVGPGLLGLFDPQYYLMANADVATAGMDPLAHYRTYGWREGRNPNAFFDTGGYLLAHPDVDAAGLDPLEHYAAHGWREGRDPGPAFDTERYLAAYADVAGAGLDPLEHFLRYGYAEGREAFGDGSLA